MSENPLPNTPTDPENWKTRTYAMGVTLGAIMGFLTAYLFARQVEENEDGKPQAISTGTLIGLAVSIMSLMRQIAESGKPNKPNKK